MSVSVEGRNVFIRISTALAMLVGAVVLCDYQQKAFEADQKATATAQAMGFTPTNSETPLPSEPPMPLASATSPVTQEVTPILGNDNPALEIQTQHDFIEVAPGVYQGIIMPGDHLLSVMRDAGLFFYPQIGTFTNNQLYGLDARNYPLTIVIPDVINCGPDGELSFVGYSNQFPESMKQALREGPEGNGPLLCAEKNKQALPFYVATDEEAMSNFSQSLPH